MKIDEGIISKVNSYFYNFISIKDSYIVNIGKGTDFLPEDKSNLLTQKIPSLLCKIFGDDQYEIEGSPGRGKVAKTPWVAVMDKSITTSTQKGVYLVFLFNTEMDGVYLSLGIGATEFGTSLTKKVKGKIEKKRDGIRTSLGLTKTHLNKVNELNVRNDLYKFGNIYSCEWPLNSPSDCVDILNEFMEAYSLYVTKTKSTIPTTVTPSNTDIFSIERLIDLIKETGLLYGDLLIKRFAYSLLTKPFVILSGLSGSGKTQLAIAFAKALIKDDSQLCVVPVGADWTNREPLLGYPNALDNNSYVRPESGVLDLLIEANKAENSKKPYFLILDEMNLSYVERYFADFLSAMESHMEIHLWNGKDSKTPESVTLSKNVFIIGTINVDETTYMFSPKVLDRASVIEFKVSEEEMKTYLEETRKVNSDHSKGKASSYAEDFVKIAGEDIQVNDASIGDILVQFFSKLKTVNAEFGYRTASEIYRFLGLATNNGSMSLDEAVDSAIIQKLLPKLHGSRKKIDQVLKELWELCVPGISLDELNPKVVPPATKYKLSADKILRMHKSAIDNGFTSFAEA